jgi:hypothetical protein
MALWSEAAARRAALWSECASSAAFEEKGPAASTGDAYAALLASATLGRPAVAGYLLACVVARWLSAPGEFHPLDEPEHMRRRSFLKNGAVLLSAARLGRADLLGEPALRRLFSYQHKGGGFFDMDPAQGLGIVEAFTTAWGGRLALRFGRFDAAKRAAHLLAEVIYAQPDPDGRLYFCYETTPSGPVARWQVGEQHARYLAFDESVGETHQLGMTLALLAEMHLAEPAAGWDRPLNAGLRLVERWPVALVRRPALASVAEGLAIAGWALGRAGEAVRPLLREALSGVAEAVSPSGKLPPWDSGLGPEYGRAFSPLETAGWSALCLAGMSQALLNIKS